MNTPVVKVKGVEITLGGIVRVVPPLSLGSIEQLRDDIDKFTGGGDMKSMSVVVDAAFAALKRNYPEITREEVANDVGLENMTEIFNAVMNSSGMQARSQARIQNSRNGKK